jgi:hypothetical protein
MADRTNAAKYAARYERLARNPTPENKIRARKLWEEMQAYDFEPYQMYADEALQVLDLPLEYTTRPLERWVAGRNMTPPSSGMSFGSVALLVASAAGVAFYLGRKSTEPHLPTAGTGAGIRASNPTT